MGNFSLSKMIVYIRIHLKQIILNNYQCQIQHFITLSEKRGTQKGGEGCATTSFENGD